MSVWERIVVAVTLLTVLIAVGMFSWITWIWWLRLLLESIP